MSLPRHLLQLHGVIMDMVYHVEAVPTPGTEALVSHAQLTPGGGFNAMASAKRMGIDVTYAGKLGGGPLGAVVKENLEAEGIDCLLPADPTRDQGCCTVLIDAAGERTFIASEGAEGYITATDLAQIKINQFGWSLASGYSLYYEGSQKTLTDWLLRADRITNLVFDPSPIIASIPHASVKAALNRATWISANETEAKILTDEADPAAAALKLSADRQGGALVRTGAEGCFIATDGIVHSIPGHFVHAVDTNGAGDAHLGAFIASLAHGASPIEAAHAANIAAALSTTKFGPSTAPYRATADQLLHRKEAV